jgi:hypothetical protein
MSLQGHQPEATSIPIRYFNSKGDYHTAKQQKTVARNDSIYKMYGRELFHECDSHLVKRNVTIVVQYRDIIACDTKSILGIIILETSDR